METIGTKRVTFLKKCEEKSPVKMCKLSVSKNLSFFNSNTGSRLEEMNSPLSFIYTEDSSVTEVTDITMELTGCITIRGKIHWLSAAKDLTVGMKMVTRQVRDALFADKTGFIPISVWGDLIQELQEDQLYTITKVAMTNFQGAKLQTTGGSQLLIVDAVDGGFDVDWNKAKCDNETRVNKVIEGKISLFTLKRYLICVNKSCAKKVTPLPGDRLVKCSSFHILSNLLLINSKSLNHNYSNDMITEYRAVQY